MRSFDGVTDLLAERVWYVRNELAAALGQSKQEIYAGLDFGEVGDPSAEQLACVAWPGRCWGCVVPWAA
ncbi:ShlB/FhaC/HecB family hemolysin secretion/activation protein [Herbaspirillum rubrisubalbicans]|uniref:Haemolysin activator HlyB C-terminal domain-containing protein n=1 Tax=Herbaspirillum rubrisubalbicans Os34 TaxID=1235827 RepID=A0A6M3ZV37_9BURK|nr:ShlB/FhaC/HecB family hemolysin secretion/activation protein [Herbaspirillum rubrisubalbicans]NQE51170.1 hypothetical protein [Herbaspirillum rubrisubalbicans]QJQ02505.1 hypothetical protein C798_20425 [Herbaspirillum rubrisubalbicans Os34]